MGIDFSDNDTNSYVNQCSPQYDVMDSIVDKEWLWIKKVRPYLLVCPRSQTMMAWIEPILEVDFQLKGEAKGKFNWIEKCRCNIRVAPNNLSKPAVHTNRWAKRVWLYKDGIVPTRWSWISQPPLVGQAPSWVCMMKQIPSPGTIPMVAF